MKFFPKLTGFLHTNTFPNNTLQYFHTVLLGLKIKIDLPNLIASYKPLDQMW